MDEEEFYVNDFDGCDYKEMSYFEHDTGYAEYDCTLLGDGYMCNDECPLTFKYTIIEIKH